MPLCVCVKKVYKYIKKYINISGRLTAICVISIYECVKPHVKVAIYFICGRA